MVRTTRRKRKASAWYMRSTNGYGPFVKCVSDSDFVECHFELQDGDSVSEFRICGHRLKYVGGGRNMVEHAESHGLSESDAKVFKRASQQALDSFIFHVPRVTPQRQLQLDGDLVRALCNQGLPFSILDPRETGDEDGHHDVVSKRIDEYGLRQWIAELNPGYKLPSRRVLRDLCGEQVDVLRVEMKKILSHIPFLSFTSDGWKNTSQNMHYRDLSCHGILEGDDRKLHLVSFLLGLKPMDSKDSSTVGSWMRTLLEMYGIPPEKRGVITADGAEKAAAREAGLEYWWCIGHWINLAIHDAIRAEPTIAAEIQNVKELVTAIKSSTSLQSDLRKFSSASGQLVQDVETRWSSEYLMIKSVQRNLPGLRRLWDVHGHLRLTEATISVMLDMVTLLSMPYDLLQVLEKQSDVTAMTAWQLVWSMVSAWKEAAIMTTDAGRRFKGALLTCWKWRVRRNFNTPAAKMCFFLNPRLWGSLPVDGSLEYVAEQFFQDNEMGYDAGDFPSLLLEAFVGDLTETAVQTVTRFSARAPVRHRAPPPPTDDDGNDSLFLAHLQKRARLALPGPEDATNPHVEVFRFVKVRTYSDTSDALAYYAQQSIKEQFPHIAHVAKRYLAIPATNVASESLWSETGHASTGRRSSVKPEFLECQMMVRRNARMVEAAKQLLDTAETQDGRD